ncbi:MAG: hypothetical protein Q8R15_02915 [Candidatus Micrarchaeota archaeon]|nr:hypothetical protein [Candidatus Micrarchaeota archaeon]
MADVKLIVKQMKDAGMSEADILSNLQELGIENPEGEMAKALKETASAKPSKAAAQSEESGELQITKIDGESEKTVAVDIKNMLESVSGGESDEIMKNISKTDIGNADEMEDKLDQIIALLKALQDVNKKTLETNRDILVKMGKHQQEGEKPTLGKLF